MVLVQEPGRGYVLGLPHARVHARSARTGSAALVAVYVPTNHLYLGDVVVYPRERVLFPELSVEDGVRIFLTGGMAVPLHVVTAATLAGVQPDDRAAASASEGADRPADPRDVPPPDHHSDGSVRPVRI